MERWTMNPTDPEDCGPYVGSLQTPGLLPASASSWASDEGPLLHTPPGLPASRHTIAYAHISVGDDYSPGPFRDRFDTGYDALDDLGKGWLGPVPDKKTSLLRSTRPRATSSPHHVVISSKHVSRGIPAPTAPRARKSKWTQISKTWLWDKSLGRVDMVIWHCLVVVMIPGFFGLAVKLIHDISVTQARLLVAIPCSAFGILAGFTITELAQPWLEAAQRRFILQNSQLESHRMTASKAMDLMTSPKGFKAAISLILRRLRYSDEISQQDYLSGPGIGSILFFVLLFLVGQCISFALGRAVIIDTVVKHQERTAKLVAVAADLAAIDVVRANTSQAAFNEFPSTWTFYSTAIGSGLSRNVSFQLTGDLAHELGNDTVYFAELEPSQMMPGGSGLGTFESNQATQPDMSRASALNPSQATGLGNLLRFPRWGIRIHCQRLPDPLQNLVPVSEAGLTYLYITRNLVQALYQSFNLHFPDTLARRVFNSSLVLAPGDTMPPGLHTSDILYGVQFSNNGVGHSLFSTPIDQGDAGNGWQSIEAVLIRLNNTYATSPRFPVYGPESNGTMSLIGYDAAVCLRLVEPWIVEAYNSTVTAPSSLRLVSKQAANGTVGTEDDTPVLLNSTGKFPAYVAAHDNSVNQIDKDNGRDAFYVPSPTMVSFTDGSGPGGYTELIPERVAETRALADSLNLLPYLTGSGKLFATSFRDKTYASARVDWMIMGLVAGVLLLLGLLAWALPHGHPNGMEVQPRKMRANSARETFPLYRRGCQDDSLGTIID